MRPQFTEQSDIKKDACQRSSQTGFTFLEILFVIIILGVMLGVSMPGFKKTFDHLQLVGFSKELASVFMYYQQRAVVEGKIFSLKIDPDRRVYEIQIENDTNPVKTYAIPQGIKLDSAMNEISFYPDGTSDKVMIRVLAQDQDSMSLSNKDIWGGVRLEAQ